MRRRPIRLARPPEACFCLRTHRPDAVVTHITIATAVLSGSRVAAVVSSALSIDLTHPPAVSNGITVTRQAIRRIPVLAVEVEDDARVIQAALEAARIPFLMRTSRQLYAFVDGQSAAVRCDVDGGPVAGIGMIDGRPMANVVEVAALARYTQLSEAVLHSTSAPAAASIVRLL